MPGENYVKFPYFEPLCTHTASLRTVDTIEGYVHCILLCKNFVHLMLLGCHISPVEDLHFPSISQYHMKRLQGYYKALVILIIQSSWINLFGTVRWVRVQLLYLDFNVLSIHLPLVCLWYLSFLLCFLSWKKKKHIHFMTFWKCGINNSWNIVTKI